MMFGVLVAGLVVATAIVNFHDYFLTWSQLGDVRLNYQADLGVLAHYLDTNPDPTPVSVCSTPVDKKNNPFTLTNQELLAYLMHRQAFSIRYFDCTQSLVLAEGGASQRLIFPRGHYYDHLPGPLLAWLRYAEDEHVPGVRPDVVMRLEAEEELANNVGAFITTALTAWPPEAVDTESELAELPVTFGHNVSFLGYDLRDETVRPGDWVELTTYWRMDGPPPSELNHFTHMLGSPVIIVAQRDNLGIQPGLLQVRDVFLQHNLVQAPPGLSPGPYILSVGLYFPSTDERLPAFAGGEYQANRLFLQSVTIVEP